MQGKLPWRFLQSWHRIALGAILFLSIGLNFYRLGQLGSVNTYYEVGVKSMLMSWHNFFFVSFDPGGFVTIDKPPLGFWIQAASAKVFGLSNLSLLLPEALAGVLAVAVLYHVVKRVFGPVAGLLAALALALSPISVSTSRNTTIDTLLVLTVLLAAWAVSLAAETGRLRWLLLCALLVGLGFNIKMMEAYLVVPAFGLVYLLGAPQPWLKRILHLFMAVLVLVVVSFAWITAVDLTPAAQRPYVGSSQDNSELSLAIGYNGIQRLTGQIGLFAQGRSTSPSNPTPLQNEPQQLGNRGGGFGQGENGAPGPLRLLNQQMGRQLGWLLPLALLGLVIAACMERLRFPLNRRQQALCMWGMWLLTMGTFFSVAGFFHIYYTVMLVPSICVLFGVGIVSMWQCYRRPGWSNWLLPLVLVLAAAVQAFLLAPYTAESSWLTPLIIGFCLLAAVMLVLIRLFAHLDARSESDLHPAENGRGVRRPLWNKGLVLYPFLTVGVLALLIAPAVWSITTVLSNRAVAFGGAGPTPTNIFGRARQGQGNPFGNIPRDVEPNFEFLQGNIPLGGFGQGRNRGDAQLEKYLLTHQGNTKFILATQNSMTASPLILDTSKPVMALGGFAGADPILTQQQLASLVQNGTVRFFLLPLIAANASVLAGGFGRAGQNGALVQWVNRHCTTVPVSQWQSAMSGNASGFARGGFGGAQQLFDCANIK